MAYYLDDAAASWERLRATRHAPPAPAISDQLRRRTYISALEQAEQLFRAATVVSPAARPLPLFYGLSQAGRTIAAASPKLGGNAWQLRGHGIKCYELEGALSSVRVDIAGKSGSAGSFVRLSEVLNSPLWEDGVVDLGHLWDSLPVNRVSPLVEPLTHRRTALELALPDFSQSQHPLLTAAIDFIPLWVVESAVPRDALSDYLSSFPGAADYDNVTIRGDVSRPPAFEPHVDRPWALLFANWYAKDTAPATVAERQAFMDSITLPYLGGRWFFPDITRTGQPLHPLLTWWCVLFALSMLARYQPAEWANHIDVDQSPHAVPLERILTDALTTVPALVYETLNFS